MNSKTSVFIALITVFALGTATEAQTRLRGPPVVAVNQRETSKKQNESAQDTAQRKSVRPGINKNFLDADLDVDQWVKRFEVESREVFSARHKVLKAIDVRPGWSIADVGAGTGLYTRLFSEAVGNSGQVFAVDISPRFIQNITQQIKAGKLANVKTVLCKDDSVELPSSSVDCVFVCDTYHHFEYPGSTLASIHRALRKEGTLIVIDFERIPGKSRAWTINHVRAGKEVFTQEMEAAGFRLEGQAEIEGFEENYFLKFRKR